ncbi:MAG: hypothetical protein NTY53_07725 [Kiritimatiellaeota bacterium]|nr:hypothetical protein [Kiritimatiellota bacterium]
MKMFMRGSWVLCAALMLFTAAASAAESAALQVGFGRVDITPPVGGVITGPGAPVSTGVDDPLRASALVVASGGRKLAIVSVDLAEAAIALATQRTGLAREAILICPTHNHSSPLIPAQGDKNTINKDYIATLPKLIADSIEQANQALQPASLFIGRSLVYEGHCNRRLISKADGLVLNTWLKKLSDLQQVPQVLGTEGPIDPELWVARFDALDGKVLGTLVNFTCHPCLHDRIKTHNWSADFPGVIAEHIAQVYGKQAISVFIQGSSGNIQPPVTFTPDWRARATVFANAAVEAATNALAIKGPVAVDYARRDVAVPRCDVAAQRDGAIARLGWRPEAFEGAKRTAAKMPATLTVPVSAARIGPLGIATNPGELFVEWGLDIKKRSPFLHTIVAELTNEAIGYEPTVQAFAHEGYEPLAGANFVAPAGIQTLVDTAVDLLQTIANDAKR